KSIDAGGSWALMNSGLSSTTVFAVAIDPSTPTTLYAGTTGGVFKSTNAGTNWAAMNAGLTSSNVLSFAINPVMPLTVYAGTDGNGVFDFEATSGATTTTTTVSTTTTTRPFLCGDVNGDGAVNVGDALTTSQYDIGLRRCGQVPFSHPEACDVNHDGACNIG